MKVRVNASEFQEKHARRLKASEPDIRKGIAAVEEAPGKKAAAKQAKMKTHLIAKIDDGTWARRVAAVPLEEWKSKAADKGVPRISAGIDAAKDKVVGFAEKLLPAVEAAASKVEAMPDVTLEDSINRMTSYVRDMAKFKKE